MTKVNYIIVGQGLAGTLLTRKLMNLGKTVLVVDHFNKTSSSNVGAGILNPITGKRFVKSWLADTIFPFAGEEYNEFEKELQTKFYHPMQIVRILTDPLEIKEYEKKRQKPEYEDYLYANQRVSAPGASINIQKGGYVNFRTMLSAFRNKLREEKAIYESHFTFHDLTLGREEIAWKEYAAEKLIFCEGYHVINNPFFGNLPFTHTKGEILTIRSEELEEDKLINGSVFILPVGNKLFRVGSTYEWDNLNDTPTEKAKNEISSKLNDMIGRNYEIVDHQAGIRPTIADRRPVMGLLRDNRQFGIFNGLGTKGASLGPYFASRFADYLVNDKPLMREVDLKRFD